MGQSLLRGTRDSRNKLVADAENGLINKRVSRLKRTHVNRRDKFKAYACTLESERFGSRKS